LKTDVPSLNSERRAFSLPFLKRSRRFNGKIFFVNDTGRRLKKQETFLRKILFYRF
jgi:hypothetical protein